MRITIMKAIVLLYPTVIFAAPEARIPTPSELGQLPLYCKDTQIISKFYGRQQGPASYDASTATWVNAYGETFWHMHHYCFAMTYVLRSHRMVNQSERMGLLGQSLGEFDYVLKSADESFPLRSEVYMRKAQALVLLRRGSEAVIEFRKAISSKADYPSPYGFLSDYFVEAGDKTRAISVLEEGLTVNPTSEILKRRYQKMGGKKIFEIPAASEAPVAQEPAKKIDEAEQVRQPEVIKAEPTPEERGGNPYCRFCP